VENARSHSKPPALAPVGLQKRSGTSTAGERRHAGQRTPHAPLSGGRIYRTLVGSLLGTTAVKRRVSPAHTKSRRVPRHGGDHYRLRPSPRAFCGRPCHRSRPLAVRANLNPAITSNAVDRRRFIPACRLCRRPRGWGAMDGATLTWPASIRTGKETKPWTPTLASLTPALRDSHRLRTCNWRSRRHLHAACLVGRTRLSWRLSPNGRATPPRSLDRSGSVASRGRGPIGFYRPHAAKPTQPRLADLDKTDAFLTTPKCRKGPSNGRYSSGRDTRRRLRGARVGGNAAAPTMGTPLARKRRAGDPKPEPATGKQILKNDVSRTIGFLTHRHGVQRHESTQPSEEIDGIDRSTRRDKQRESRR